jgi:hypothetical protein
VEVSPLALMNENSPEAWLGQFLLKLDAPTSTARGTIEGAKRDAALLQYLSEVRASSAQAQPLRLLELGHGEQLKQQDWSAWWKAQGSLLSYAYSALALSLLGDRGSLPDLGLLYKQDANMQMHKDAHYVLCYILGKPWPAYHVTESDLGRLTADQPDS